jgi:hypothetical protein
MEIASPDNKTLFGIVNITIQNISTKYESRLLPLDMLEVGMKQRYCRPDPISPAALYCRGFVLANSPE